VELDIQHLLRIEMIARLQIVANLLRARAEVVAAVADQIERVAGNDALVGRPDARTDWILDARILRGRRVADPTRARFRPVGRRGRIETRAQRNHAAGDAPPDVA